jgi:hypothetical protein
MAASELLAVRAEFAALRAEAARHGLSRARWEADLTERFMALTNDCEAFADHEGTREELSLAQGRAYVIAAKRVVQQLPAVAGRETT